MENYAYAVALVLGSLMLLSVCFVYIKHQMLPMGGIAMSLFSVILVGMSVWQSIDVSFDQQGFQAKLDQSVDTANEAKEQAEEAEQRSLRNAEATLALRDTVEVFKAQDALRTAGLYEGALNGELNAVTKRSIVDFQKANNLPRSGTLDAKTIEKLQIAPVTNFPNLEGLRLRGRD